MRQNVRIGKSLITFVLMCSIAFLLNACTNEGRDASTGNGSASGTGTPRITDADIENAIKTKFNDDVQLRAANISVDADVDNNSVTLSGTVESQALRTRAVELAKGARANMVVTDKIDVQPREISRAEYTEEYAREQRARAKNSGETIGSSLDDAWIHTKITTKLLGNATTPGRKINVDVNNNVVTLRGTVDTAAEKSEAERVARQTDGVKQVVNRLAVNPARS